MENKEKQSEIERLMQIISLYESSGKHELTVTINYLISCVLSNVGLIYHGVYL